MLATLRARTPRRIGSTAAYLVQENLRRPIAEASPCSPHLPFRGTPQLHAPNRLWCSSNLPRRDSSVPSAGSRHPRTDFRMTHASPSISLDPIEEEIVSLLDCCCDWINAERPQPSEAEGGSQVDYTGEVTARIAGGWVRDKLLGMDSHDLDVSLSVMTGLNFAILFKAFLLQREKGAASGASSSTRSAAASAMSRITKISANPEQSKSLETATANILGLSLDFVNLRKEIYEGNSRIPIMSFGTPLEDAERRDITINSLFYNVKTRQVEDWTEKGLLDMRAGLIRTPLPPLTTFLDDPLRVLRCIRFASRFNYELDTDVRACLEGTEDSTQISVSDDPRLQDVDPASMSQKGRELVRDALMKKVSRERVGIEVDKMLSGPNPLLALRLLKELDLYSLVFHIESLQSACTLRLASTQTPISTPDPQAASSLAIAASQILDDLSPHPTAPTDIFSQIGLPEEITSPLTKPETRRLLHFASALLPLSDVEVEEKKSKWSWSGEKILMAGLKLGRNNTLLPVLSLIRAFPFLSDPSAINSSRASLLQNLPDQTDIAHGALVALLLRDKNLHNPSIGIEWKTGLTMAFVKDVLDVKGDAARVRRIVDAYSAFCKYVRDTRIEERLDEKPLMDGKELLSVLSLSPSPLLPKIQNGLLIWQLSRPPPSNPTEVDSTRQEARQWLKARWEAGEIVDVDKRSGAVVKSGTKKKGQQQLKERGEEGVPHLEKRRKSEE